MKYSNFCIFAKFETQNIPYIPYTRNIFCQILFLFLENTVELGYNDHGYNKYTVIANTLS